MIVYLNVKFRAFGVTFGTVEKSFNVDIVNKKVASVDPPQEPSPAMFTFSERGVTLVIGF